MPVKKYRVDTDHGSYVVDVEEPEPDIHAVNASEPDTYLGGALKGAKEGIVGGAKGFAEGFVPGAIRSVVGAPMALARGAVDTVKGAYNLVTDPSNTLSDAASAIRNIPHAAGEKAAELAHLAATDPEAYGKIVGDTTGAVETGIALSRALPLAPTPVARALGNTLTKVGTEGKWPIRMMGAHQLGSGNPMGVLTMMAPEGLAASGRALTSAATEAGAAAATLPGRFLELQQDIRTGANADTVPTRLDALQEDLIARRKVAKLPEQVKQLQQEQNGLDRLRKMVKPVEPPDDSGGGSGGGSLAAPPQEDLIVGGRRLSEMSPEQAAKFRAAYEQGQPASGAGIRTLGGGPYKRPAVPKAPQVSPTRMGELEQKFGGTGGAPAAEPVATPSAYDDYSRQFDAEMAGEPKPAKVPITEVPPTKSRNPMSATPGLTRSDVQALGLNPDIPITGLTQDAIDAILERRKHATATYRANRGVEAVGRNNLDLRSVLEQALLDRQREP